jgi:hypothetical protein
MTVGAIGPQGPKGAAGATGPRGIAGATGPQGIPGPSGSDPAFGNGTNTASGQATGATCTIGQVLLTASPIAQGYVANGQYLSRTQEPILFDLLGITYGDDPNGLGFLFRLPDLTAAAPNGMTYSICARGVFPSL